MPRPRPAGIRPPPKRLGKAKPIVYAEWQDGVNPFVDSERHAAIVENRLARAAALPPDEGESYLWALGIGSRD